MNMRFHMNKNLAEILFLVIMLLCMQAEAQRDNEFVHKETVVNQHRLMEVTGTDPSSAIAAANQTNIITPASNSTKSNTTKEDKDRAMSFWGGFIDSLSMIFFVEFGDRVIVFLIT